MTAACGKPNPRNSAIAPTCPRVTGHLVEQRKRTKIKRQLSLIAALLLSASAAFAGATTQKWTAGPDYFQEPLNYEKSNVKSPCRDARRCSGRLLRVGALRLCGSSRGRPSRLRGLSRANSASGREVQGQDLGNVPNSFEPTCHSCALSKGVNLSPLNSTLEPLPTPRHPSTSTPSRATLPKPLPRNTALGTPVQLTPQLAAPSTSSLAPPAAPAATVSPLASTAPRGAFAASPAAPPSAPTLQLAVSSSPTRSPTVDAPPAAALPPPATPPPAAAVPPPSAAAPAPKNFAEPCASCP